MTTGTLTSRGISQFLHIINSSQTAKDYHQELLESGAEQTIREAKVNFKLSITGQMILATGMLFAAKGYTNTNGSEIPIPEATQYILASLPFIANTTLGHSIGKTLETSIDLENIPAATLKNGSLKRAGITVLITSCSAGLGYLVGSAIGHYTK